MIKHANDNKNLNLLKRKRLMSTRKRYFTVPQCFQPIDANKFQGVRQSTVVEKQNYLEALRNQGHSMFDSAGEPVLAPPITYVSLRGKTWEIVKMKVKVPFETINLQFKGYGLIKSVETGEELYLQADVIKQMPLKSRLWYCT